MLKTQGYAAFDANSPLRSFNFERREPMYDDVVIQILYCGVCHSDIHQVRNEWHGSSYPIVPGHEIVGRVLAVGSWVKNFKVGDAVGVGCMVDSCQTCSECVSDRPQHCSNVVFTYNSPDKHTGLTTYGGYSNKIVVNQNFVLAIPEGMDLARVAPLLCAGITTYIPFKPIPYYVKCKVGVVGLGGLGHMAIKFSKSYEYETVVFTTSPHKVADAKRLGADQVVISTDSEQMLEHVNSFDLIIDTVSAAHDLNEYINLLYRGGTLWMLGVPEQPVVGINVHSLIFKQRKLTGSLIGGPLITKEMLEYCAKTDILADIELIPIHAINEAYERMLKNDVKYRFVIDMSSLSAES